MFSKQILFLKFLLFHYYITIVVHAFVQPLHFVVLTMVYERPSDPDFTIARHMSLASSLYQTYTNWFAVIIGDGISTNAEKKFLSQMEDFPSHRYIFRNLEVGKTEKHIYRHRQPMRCPPSNPNLSIWCWAGKDHILFHVLMCKYAMYYYYYSLKFLK